MSGASAKLPGMSQTRHRVVEAHPATCSHGHEWNRPKSHIPGWDSGVLSGGMGHRIWTCATCGDVIHRQAGEPVFR